MLMYTFSDRKMFQPTHFLTGNHLYLLLEYHVNFPGNVEKCLQLT